MIRNKLNKIWNHKITKPVIAISGFLCLFIVFKIFNYSTEENEHAKDYYNSHMRVLSLKIPKDLNFANEKVPVNDLTVIESLDRELLINTYWQSQTVLLIKRANRWFPVIEPILKKNNIPDDFKYLAVVESGLTNIISPAKATGYWQLMEETAKQYDLEINDEVDERYNMEKSTEAACKYFKEAYKNFNNWTLVAASYNIGMGGLQGHLNRQKVKTYYDLYLNEETARYVFRALALKDIMTRPQAYGFHIKKKDLYPTFQLKKIKIDSAITNLTEFAIAQGANLKILKMLNPWLRSNTLTNIDKKTYVIYLPSNMENFLNAHGLNEVEEPAVNQAADTLKQISLLSTHTDSIQHD